MKNIKSLALLGLCTLFLWSCGGGSEGNGESTSNSEDFSVFYEKFTTDSAYQVAAIAFPIEYIPDYTFVFYFQMPDNLSEDDGKLFFKDYDGKEYSILPNVGECIILKGDVPHAPIDAPNSSKDRIVLAGNVTFLNNKLKKTFI